MECISSSTKELGKKFSLFPSLMHTHIHTQRDIKKRRQYSGKTTIQMECISSSMEELECTSHRVNFENFLLTIRWEAATLYNTTATALQHHCNTLRYHCTTTATPINTTATSLP